MDALWPVDRRPQPLRRLRLRDGQHLGRRLRTLRRGDRRGRLDGRPVQSGASARGIHVRRLALRRAAIIVPPLMRSCVAARQTTSKDEFVDHRRLLNDAVWCLGYATWVQQGMHACGKWWHASVATVKRASVELVVDTEDCCATVFIFDVRAGASTRRGGSARPLLRLFDHLGHRMHPSQRRSNQLGGRGEGAQGRIGLCLASSLGVAPKESLRAA